MFEPRKGGASRRATMHRAAHPGRLCGPGSHGPRNYDAVVVSSLLSGTGAHVSGRLRGIDIVCQKPPEAGGRHALLRQELAVEVREIVEADLVADVGD